MQMAVKEPDKIHLFIYLKDRNILNPFEITEQLIGIHAPYKKDNF